VCGQPHPDDGLGSCHVFMMGPKQRSGPMGLYRMVLSQHMTRLEHCDASHMRPKIPALSKNFSRSKLISDPFKSLTSLNYCLFP
jgi:hypothetical protein